jgi:hypothetical protein
MKRSGLAMSLKVFLIGLLAVMGMATSAAAIELDTGGRWQLNIDPNPQGQFAIGFTTNQADTVTGAILWSLDSTNCGTIFTPAGGGYGWWRALLLRLPSPASSPA